MVGILNARRFVASLRVSRENKFIAAIKSVVDELQILSHRVSVIKEKLKPG